MNVQVVGKRPSPDPVWPPVWARRARGLSEEMRGCARILRGAWVQPREQWSEAAGGRREYLRGVAIFADVLGILLGSVCSDLDCARVVT